LGVFEHMRRGVVEGYDYYVVMDVWISFLIWTHGSIINRRQYCRLQYGDALTAKLVPRETVLVPNKDMVGLSQHQVWQCK